MNQQAQIGKLKAMSAKAMHVDAAWARHVLGGAAKRLQKGKKVDDLLRTVSERLENSVRVVQRRRDSLPGPEYDDALPITAHREEIIDAIREHPVVVVAGETGSGKTTQLPKFCLEAGRGTKGFIGCTQPRRIAARAMAERVSEELGTR
ncbi:MAG: ATP-dependent RNA helicase HrpA, partial [Xanthomonadales bacterium]|nr:ATP-dependent RNA helicase HrpA [Xanthomonadales bacterium]